MASRRGFQAVGDGTPVMRPAERVPLRDLQNEIFEQVSTGSATQAKSSIIDFKKMGDMAELQAEVLPHFLPARSMSTSMASVTEKGITKQTLAAIEISETKSAFTKSCHEFPTADEFNDRLQAGVDGSTVLDVERAAVDCLNDRSTINVVQASYEDSTVEHCTDFGVGDVTFKSFVCSEAQVEISETSCLPEETVLPLTGAAADDWRCGLFQSNHSECCDSCLSISQHSDLSCSYEHKDHAYCLLKRDDSSVLHCTDGFSALCFPQEDTTGSYSNLEDDTAAHRLTVDQSQGTASQNLALNQTQAIAGQSLGPDRSHVIAEQSLAADQSRGTAVQALASDQSQDSAVQSFSPDQSLDTAEKGVAPEQSQAMVEQSLAADQSQDTAVQGLTYDQSQDTAEKSLAADQSQDSAVQGLASDQSQDMAEKYLSADQSQDTAVQGLTSDQSQGKAEKSLAADQSQGKAEKSLAADQSQGKAEKSLSADQSQDKAEKSLTADKSQDTAALNHSAVQPQDMVKQSPAADTSQATAVQKLTADQSQDTAEHTSVADKSLDTAVQGLSSVQSQEGSVQSLSSDQSKGTAVPGLNDDQSQDIAAQYVPADQSLTAESRMCEPFKASILPVGVSDTPERSQEGHNSSHWTPFGAGLQTPNMASSTRLRMLAPGCTLEAGSSLARARESRLWMGNLESPMPPPQLNSTLINSILTAAAATPCARKTAAVLVAPPAEAVPDVRTGPSHEQLGPKAPADPVGTQTGPLQALGDLLGTQSGPLQEQLRQMGELLLRASENMVPLVERPPVEHHSVFAATSPVQMADHGVNTSGIFERKREPSVAEASTSTDSLLWNLAPESLSEWPRQDLEQRLFSTLIMVEALSQQLASARAHGQGGGPRPSDLRDKVVQTDHTELSQGIYREMYLKAVERIQALELDQDHLRSLLQEMRNSRTAMTTLTAETEEALARVNEMSTIASEDQENISEQMCRIKGLYRKFRETLKRMEEKSQQCIQEKCSMEQQKEEALKTKDAALSVLEEMRTRHTAQIAALERSVGSHMELIPALSNAHKEQVALNEDYVESLQAADELLKDTICDQSKLNEELCKAQFLLQRTRPVLLKLNERAAAALQACRQQQEETNQMQDELEQSNSRLQDAEQQIGDLTLQLTIVNSEMGVLRQRLEEQEVERSQVEVRSTELSATLCSTQASYTYLQQVHNAETHRLEELLGQSAQRVEELGVALAERDQQLGQAQRHLQDLQKQLSDTREFNEFLQAENELSREQVAESEVLVKSHLQGLRERNLECEDLKQAQHELQLQKDSLQEELHSTQAKARSMLLEMGEQLAMASTNITLLHHEIYTTTSMLKTSLTSQEPDSSSKERGSQQPAAPPRNAPSSFVDTIMVAVTAEDAQISETELEDNQSTALGSGNSAFTRVPTTTPKKDVEDQSDVLEQLSGLGEAVSELVRTVDQLREQKQSRCDELQHTVDSLQGELHTVTFSHKSQVADLKEQVAHLQVQLERDAAALQHKAQEEKTLRKICSDMDETRELFQQQKVENKELRREVFELRRSLQQAQLELQVVREELSSSQSAERMPALEEKIRLQKEIDKLKRSLTETEDSRSRLLERAKRHQLVHETNQRKLERELQVLDQMIETVRKTLSSIPLVVKDCEELQRLLTYLG